MASLWPSQIKHRQGREPKKTSALHPLARFELLQRAFRPMQTYLGHQLSVELLCFGDSQWEIRFQASSVCLIPGSRYQIFESAQRHIKLLGQGIKCQ